MSKIVMKNQQNKMQRVIFFQKLASQKPSAAFFSPDSLFTCFFFNCHYFLAFSGYFRDPLSFRNMNSCSFCSYKNLFHVNSGHFGSKLRLEDCRLEDCRLKDCRLEDCRLEGCKLEDCRLIIFTNRIGKPSFPYCWSRNILVFRKRIQQ